MILPPLPEPLANGYYAEECMCKYALLAIKEYKASVSKRQSHQKFNSAEVDSIRYMVEKQGYTYKFVYRLYPMSEVTFINIIKRRGAYK